MRRFIAAGVAAAGFWAMAATPAVAESDNAAVVIKIDEDVCFGGVDGLSSEGTVHYVETSNGKWKLTCQGTYSGGSISSALVNRSTDENPLDGCFTPFGVSFTWTEVYSPSGHWKISCQGDLTP